jgi:hypothetical protein
VDDLGGVLDEQEPADQTVEGVVVMSYSTASGPNGSRILMAGPKHVVTRSFPEKPMRSPTAAALTGAVASGVDRQVQPLAGAQL